MIQYDGADNLRLFPLTFAAFPALAAIGLMEWAPDRFRLRLSRWAAAAGAVDIDISFYWRANRPLDRTCYYGVEVRDAQGAPIGRLGTAPLGGLFSTARWLPRGVFRDDARVQLHASQRTIAQVFVGWYE